MRNKDDGPPQVPGDRIAARPSSSSPSTSEPGETPELRPLTRPRDLSREASICFNATLSIHAPAGDQSGAGDTLPLGTTLRRYVLIEQVGQGAMGVVYAAYDYALDRKVAVKLLREPRHSNTARLRLMREAQVLAKLKSPNVVAVHDIGIYHGQLFIAMEYVDGRTLRHWREEEQRSLREVLAVFRAAGEGLAAAHAAGIVHRDFKPDNVLVDQHGRVRVSDFGLATETHEPSHSTDPTRGSKLASELSGGGDVLTRTGMIFGTPAYMALEQHRGKREIDARADQFSFAVALYESACGVHPFEGETRAQLVDNIQHGRIRPPRRRVPGWLVRALGPALAADPAHRHPTMDALLRKLRDRRPLRVGAVAASAAVAAAVSFFVAGSMFASRTGAPKAAGVLPEPFCQGAERKLDGVWNKAGKQQIAEVFRATGSPLADKAWADIERELDRYAATWTKMHTEACQSARVPPDESELLLPCLIRRSADLRAFVNVLVKVNADMIQAGIDPQKRLLPLESCVPDPAARARVAELRARNAGIRGLLATGQSAKALPEGRQLVADAAELRYPPVHAEALLTLAGLLWAQSEFSAAEDRLFEAVEVAEAGREPRIAVEALLEGVWVVGEEQGRYAEAHRYAQMARAKLTGIGGDDRLEALLEDSEGVLWLNQKNLARARPQLQRGFELNKRVHKPPSHQVSASLDHLGLLAQAEQRFGDAVQMFHDARKMAEKVHGNVHSVTLTYLAHEAKALYQVGRYDEASELNQEGFELLEEEDEVGVMFLANLGLLEWKRKQYDPARKHLAQALAITEKSHGPDHLSVADAANDLGLVLVDMGRLAEATVQLARARDIYERVFGAAHPDLATVLVQLASVHLAARKPALAVPLLERALSIREQANSTADKIAEVHALLKRAR